MTSGKSIIMVLVGGKQLEVFSYMEQGIGTAATRLRGTWNQDLLDAGHCRDRHRQGLRGQTSVTNITDGLKREKKDGTLTPNFRF